MVFNLRTFSFTASVKGDPAPPKGFSPKELRAAALSFGGNNVVGGGYFGTVYRGHLADGSHAVIDPEREEIFESEMQVARSVSAHPNLLCLRGFCRTKKELFLVYHLMNNNSLSCHLTERPDRFARPLNWTTRKWIALGAVRGLAHLHNQGNIKITHLNICTSSILLNVHLEAVIGGFSCAMITHERNVVEGTVEGVPFSSPVGENSADSGSLSQSCSAFEFLFTSECTLKNDAFGYGYMLLELISGQSIGKLWESLDNDNLPWREWIGDLTNKNELERVIDPNLQGNYSEEEAEQLVRLALLCAHEDPSVRPEISEVVRMVDNQFFQRDPSSRRTVLLFPSYSSLGYYSMTGMSMLHHHHCLSPSITSSASMSMLYVPLRFHLYDLPVILSSDFCQTYSTSFMQ